MKAILFPPAIQAATSRLALAKTSYNFLTKYHEYLHDSDEYDLHMITSLN
jgi:hypothetical protein